MRASSPVMPVDDARKVETSRPPAGGLHARMVGCRGLGSLIVLLCLGWGAPAHAVPKGDADVVATLRKAQGMLRQLSQEKAELEARSAELEKNLEDTRKSLEAQTSQLDARLKEIQTLQADVKRRADTMAILEKNNEILKSNNEKIKQQYGEQLKAAREQIQALSQQGRELAAALNDNQQDNATLVMAVKERTAWIDKCAQNNNQLIKANKDILENFQNQDFWDKLKDVEPLTGIGSVAKENRIEAFRYKLNDLKVTPWADGANGNQNSAEAPGGR